MTIERITQRQGKPQKTEVLDGMIVRAKKTANFPTVDMLDRRFILIDPDYALMEMLTEGEDGQMSPDYTATENRGFLKDEINAAEIRVVRKNTVVTIIWKPTRDGRGMIERFKAKLAERIRDARVA